MNANIFAELVKRRLSKYTDSQAHRRNNRKKKENPFSNKRFHCLIFAWRVLFRRSRIIACRAFSAHSVSRRYSAQQPTSIGIRMILIHYINYLSDNIYSSSLSTRFMAMLALESWMLREPRDVGIKLIVQQHNVLHVFSSQQYSLSSSTHFSLVCLFALSVLLTLPPFLSRFTNISFVRIKRWKRERERERAKYVIMLVVGCTMFASVSVCARTLLINRFRCNVYSSR